MRFSIRSLLGITLLVALLIQMIQIAAERNQVEHLADVLDSDNSRYKKLESEASWLRKRMKVREEVVRNFQYPSEAYVAAKARFERWQRSRPDK